MNSGKGGGGGRGLATDSGAATKTAARSWRILAYCHQSIFKFPIEACARSHHGRWEADGRYSRSDAAKGAASRKRSEEHTSELQSLMRTSYAVFCLKQTNTTIL